MLAWREGQQAVRLGLRQSSPKMISHKEGVGTAQDVMPGLGSTTPLHFIMTKETASSRAFQIWDLEQRWADLYLPLRPQDICSDCCAELSVQTWLVGVHPLEKRAHAFSDAMREEDLHSAHFALAEIKQELERAHVFLSAIALAQNGGDQCLVD